jgi:hypothetical protein
MHFDATLTELERGKTYEVVARIPPDVLPGRYDEELSLSTNTPKPARLTIPVHLFVKPDLYANPDVIDFGSVPADPMRKDPAILALSEARLTRRVERYKGLGRAFDKAV